MFGIDTPEGDLQGMIPRSAVHIFKHIENDTEDTEFEILCSFLEIYQEKIMDLLDPKKKDLQVRESPSKGIFVENLTEESVSSAGDISALLALGERARHASFTRMNATSSRSHSVFIVSVRQTRKEGGRKQGKLNLVDLAGSEKVGKTGASGETLEEAKKINQSLSALGNVINALTEGKKHVPFRDSKLTRILQESLEGNTKTTMIVACSPHPFNVEETVSTLRFAQRAKTIKMKVKANTQKSAEELMLLIQHVQKEIDLQHHRNEQLKKELNWMESQEYVPGTDCPFLDKNDAQQANEQNSEEENSKSSADKQYSLVQTQSTHSPHAAQSSSLSASSAAHAVSYADSSLSVPLSSCLPQPETAAAEILEILPPHLAGDTPAANEAKTNIDAAQNSGSENKQSAGQIAAQAVANAVAQWRRAHTNDESDSQLNTSQKEQETTEEIKEDDKKTTRESTAADTKEMAEESLQSQEINKEHLSSSNTQPLTSFEASLYKRLITSFLSTPSQDSPEEENTQPASLSPTSRTEPPEHFIFVTPAAAPLPLSPSPLLSLSPLPFPAYSTPPSPSQYPPISPSALPFPSPSP